MKPVTLIDESPRSIEHHHHRRVPGAHRSSPSGRSSTGLRPSVWKRNPVRWQFIRGGSKCQLQCKRCNVYSHRPRIVQQPLPPLDSNTSSPIPHRLFSAQIDPDSKSTNSVQCIGVNPGGWGVVTPIFWGGESWRGSSVSMKHYYTLYSLFELNENLMMISEMRTLSKAVTFQKYKDLCLWNKIFWWWYLQS